MKNIEKITSPQNGGIKLLKKLSLKKYRNETGKFAVENLAIIYDGLQSGYDFESLFATEDFIKKHKEKFEYLKDNSESVKYYLIDEKLNKHYSELETPSGITAIYKIKTSPFAPKKSIVYLNSVNDPGNLGTIMRTCLAFGFANLIVDENCADIYNPKTINAAKDSIFKLNILKDKNNDWIKKNKNIFSIYVASSHNGTLLKKFKPSKLFCLVLGSESHGVSSDIIKITKENIKIEISESIESLNVASAAAILLYELR
ncbi:MAG: RNA methyltransferase [bacterium]